MTTWRACVLPKSIWAYCCGVQPNNEFGRVNDVGVDGTWNWLIEPELNPGLGPGPENPGLGPENEPVIDPVVKSIVRLLEVGEGEAGSSHDIYDWLCGSKSNVT